MMRYDRITLLFTQLHCLKVYGCLHQTAPPYLIVCNSALAPSLVVRPTCFATIGNRAFPVAFLRLWNIAAERHVGVVNNWNKCKKNLTV